MSKLLKPKLERSTEFLGGIFYNLSVVQTKTRITVSGVKHAGDMIRQIERLMNTSRIGTYLMLDVSPSRFSFYSYHALDVIYLLQKFIDERSNFTRVPVKTIKAIIKGIETETWVSNTFKTFPSLLDRRRLSDFTVHPLSHQEDFFTHYDLIVPKHRLSGMYSAAAAGAGKTLLSLFLQRMLPVDTVIIVCPLPTLFDVWVKTMSQFFHKEPVFWHSRMTAPIPDNVEYIIVHYEYLTNLLTKHKLPLRNRFGVILDEGHNFAEKSLRTTAFVDLCEAVKSNHTIWLSGTPLKATAVEAMSLIRTIDPLFTPDVEARARKAFAGNNVAMNALFGSRLNIYMRVVEKSDLKLPPPTEINIKIAVPDGEKYTIDSVKQELEIFVYERKQYYASRAAEDRRIFLSVLDWFERTLRSQKEIDDFRNYKINLAIVVAKNGAIMEIPDIVSYVNQYELKVIIPRLPNDLKVMFKEVRALYKYPSLKIIGEALGMVLGVRRMECFSALARALDYSDFVEKSLSKTLVFTSYVETVQVANEKCVSQHLNAVCVYGGSGIPLPKATEKMAKDETADPLLTTYNSLSTGVPLVMCSSTIFVNLPFRPHILSQAQARTWRLGQPHPVTFYYIKLDTGEAPNLSGRSEDIMRFAQETVKSITGIDYLPDAEAVEAGTQSLTGESITMNHVGAQLLEEIPEYELLYSR